MKDILLIVVMCMTISSSYASQIIFERYSNVVFHEDTGDVLGVEILFYDTNQGLYGVFVDGEGELNMPVVVPVSLNNGNISFTLPEERNGYTGKFVGKIEKGRIIGGFGSGQLNYDNKSQFVLDRQ